MLVVHHTISIHNHPSFSELHHHWTRTELLYEFHAAGMMPPLGSFTVRDDKEKHVCWVMSERHVAVACLVYVTNNSMWRLTSLGVHEANVIVFRQLVLSVPNRLHSALHILLHTGSRICTLHVHGSASATMGRAALAFATATVVAVRWCPLCMAGKACVEDDRPWVGDTCKAIP